MQRIESRCCPKWCYNHADALHSDASAGFSFSFGNDFYKAGPLLESILRAFSIGARPASCATNNQQVWCA